MKSSYQLTSLLAAILTLDIALAKPGEPVPANLKSCRRVNTWSAYTGATGTCTPCSSTVTTFVTVGPPKTSTTTTPQSTAPKETKTETVYETATSYSTSITTSYTSTTVVTSTSIVPTSPGFLPIQSTLPKGSYIPVSPYENPNVKKRGQQGVELLQRSTEKDTCSKDAVCPVTVTVTVTKSIETGSTTTVASTSSKPAEYETITETDHVTITQPATTVVKTVSTSTTVVTSYAACATSNWLSHIDGHPTSGYSLPGVIQKTNAKTPYDCCVDAIKNPLGIYWDFYVYSPQFAQCEVFVPRNNGQCTNGQNSNEPGDRIFARHDTTDRPAEIFGNANCGRLTGYEISPD